MQNKKIAALLIKNTNTNVIRIDCMMQNEFQQRKWIYDLLSILWEVKGWISQQKETKLPKIIGYVEKV